MDSLKNIPDKWKPTHKVVSGVWLGNILWKVGTKLMLIDDFALMDKEYKWISIKYLKGKVEKIKS